MNPTRTVRTDADLEAEARRLSDFLTEVSDEVWARHGIEHKDLRRLAPKRHRALTWEWARRCADAWRSDHLDLVAIPVDGAPGYGTVCVSAKEVCLGG